jgi:MoaA/NifB/PqqE/SkfB family radical SAM enzyme
MQRFATLLNLAGNRLHTLPLLVMYLTDGCNSRCISCNIWQNPRRNMPMPLVERITAQVPEMGVRWVLLSGGEAMQHPEWPHIAQQFRAQGVHTMLLTNGLLLRKQIDDVADSVDEVIVSLDGGNAATYEAIRGVDAFELILDGIRACRKRRLPVTTRTTVQRANYHEIPQIIEVGLANDVNTISFLAADVSSDEAFGERDATWDSGKLASEDVQQLTTIIDDIETQYADAFAAGRIAENPGKLRRILVRYFQALLGEAEFTAPPCNAPHFSTVIEVDGSLRPCYFLPKIGRLKPEDDRLKDAVNTSAGMEMREAYRTGQRPECQRCVCPLYKGKRALLRM